MITCAPFVPGPRLNLRFDSKLRPVIFDYILHSNGILKPCQGDRFADSSPSPGFNQAIKSTKSPHNSNRTLSIFRFGVDLGKEMISLSSFSECSIWPASASVASIEAFSLALWYYFNTVQQLTVCRDRCRCSSLSGSSERWTESVRLDANSVLKRFPFVIPLPASAKPLMRQRDPLSKIIILLSCDWKPQRSEL